MTHFYRIGLLLLILVSAGSAAAQTPEATVESATPYIVQFVEDDTPAYLYTQPDKTSGVVDMLFNSEEMSATGDVVRVGDTLWLPVQTQYNRGESGWIERYYAVANPAAEIFCADVSVRTLVDWVRIAIRAQDADRLAELIIPERGLYVGGLYWSKSVHLSQAEVQNFFSDNTVRDWGHDSYSTEPISGTFSEVIVPLFKRNLLPRGASVSCEDNQNGPMGYGLYGNDERMSFVPFYSVRRLGAPGYELDWGAWALGIDYWESQPRLVYLSTYEWQP